ncbi:alpha/beta hydrolase [Pilimelia columellifera subsp. columellifera]|uniref:Alpha/beta hydrolase n=2 Tax=Pilimelia TaxID=53370 RepID=A0ABP6AHC7_9ACTN
MLGHGAGGGVDAPDLVALTDRAVAAGALVGRVTQPYRVAGRRAPAPAGQLDAAWVAVVEVGLALAAERGWTLPLIVGGRSSGARVACRTAVGLGAVGVVALAFPTHPPGRPERSRVAELRTELPTVVVNGDRDPFGLPPPLAGVTLAVRLGERHDLRRDPGGAADAALVWLADNDWVTP